MRLTSELFFFRNLKMRLRHASCRKFPKNSYLGIQIEINRIKKLIISEKCGVKIATTPRRYRFWKVKFWRWLQFELGWLASRNETNTMPLPSMYQFFDIEFSFEFGQKDNNFGVSFYAITFAVSISSWFNFCSNFDKNSSTLACSLMHLSPACRFFVDIYRLKFGRKIINFSEVFDALTFGVSSFCVSKMTSTSNVRLQITSNRPRLTRNRGGGGVVITTASNP